MNKAWLCKLLRGTAAIVVPTPATIVSDPTFTGGAYDGNTVTASHGTWDKAVDSYESGWFISDFPYTTWSQIAGEASLTYTYVTADIGKKVRYGERTQVGGLWSSWAYSVASGIISSSSTPSTPTINSSASTTPNTGLQVGDTLSIAAPDVSNASDWWLSIERDGIVSEAFADFSDVYPIQYTLLAGDACTSFRILTFASNGAGTVNDSSTAPDIGPVTTPSSLTITDLGSAAATESMILGLLGTLWEPSGSPTHTHTVSTPDELYTYWNSTVLSTAMTAKWEITLDWDGGLDWNGSETAIDGNGNNVYLNLFGPMGATAWYDAGGWVTLKAAAGKQPAFLNQVMIANTRGFCVDGIDFAGKRNTLPGLKSGQSGPTAQAGLRIAGTGVVQNYLGEGVTCIRNCRFGRYASTLSLVFGETIGGVWADGTCEQLLIDTVAFGGCYNAMKIPARRSWVTNVAVVKNLEDIIKTYPESKSGYIALRRLEYILVYDMSRDPLTESFHADFCQHGSTSENYLGEWVSMEGCYAVMDHKYANSGTGGTQGFLVGNYPGHANNLHVARNSALLGSAPNSFSLVSPDGTHCTYLERMTLGRCGVTPSNFDGDPSNKDWTPGLAFGVGSSTRTGVQFKIVDSLIGKNISGTRHQLTNTTVVNWTASMTGITPEAVFNGADFERSGATANFKTNKFGYEHDTSSHSAFVSWLIANIVPQGTYSGKGAPAPTPANYTAPALG